MDQDHKAPASTSLAASDLRLLLYQANTLKAENEYLINAKGRDFVFNRVLNVPQPLLEFYWTTTRFIGLAFLHDGTWNSKKKRLRRLLEKAGLRPKALNLLPCNGCVQRRPRILVDVSESAVSDARTGIQRYVRAFARAACATGSALPVLIQAGQIFDAYSDPTMTVSLRAEATDTLLLLDSNWCSDEVTTQFLASFKSGGGRVVVFLHDIIPLRFPYTCQKATIESFTNWFKLMTLYADAYITSTNAGASDVAAVLQAFLHRRQPIGWVPAGTGFPDDDTGRPSKKIASSFLRPGPPVFLSVGTLEPRKGYSIALAAFEELWSSGHDAKYLIIGARGWNMRGFEKKIKSHPNYGTRLLWVEQASDADLRHAYERAAALVAPSIAEGFGLPIMEAAGFGLPTILSDIPVFREITEGKAIYFEVGNADALAHALKSFEVQRSEDRYKIKGMSWDENVARMTNMIRDNAYQLQ